MNIMLLYGGKSCEHDISVITACLARGHFAHRLYGVYFEKNNLPRLVGNDVSPREHNRAKGRKVTFCFGEGCIAFRRGPFRRKVHIDVAVNCCHGLCGEDGCVAALCRLLGVPLVGSDVSASAIAMDKVLTKYVLRTLRLPVLGYTVVTKSAPHVGEIRLPTVVKPSRLGSSIGVKMCRTEAELSEALQAAFCYDNVVLCEDALTDFAEYNCSALRTSGNVATSRVDSPTTANDILTFEDKYIACGCKGDGATDGNDIPDGLTARIRATTARIYDLLGFGGVIRVDYLFDKVRKKLYVNEINSVPGSLAYPLWKRDCTMTEFGQMLVNQAIDDYAAQTSLVTSFDSDVFSSKAGGKAKSF